ncbi:MAG TPA: DinB family protein [Vicinamibacterales bacterium]
MPAHLQPVAHSLLQSGEEIETLLAGASMEEIWRSDGSAASVGFHILHAMGSLDRLFTYARGASLSEAQRQALAQESDPNPRLSPDDLLSGFAAAVQDAINQLRGTSKTTLIDVRHVGRARLPSTVVGLMFHAAEHTQRHVGQAITTSKLMKRASS